MFMSIQQDSQLQLEQLSLSSNSRSVIAEKSGHNVHLTQPEVIADATRWVLDEFMARSLEVLRMSHI
jgi:pimeloyl-ACP methyl ester carboxylesterase